MHADFCLNENVEDKYSAAIYIVRELMQQKLLMCSFNCKNSGKNCTFKSTARTHICIKQFYAFVDLLVKWFLCFIFTPKKKLVIKSAAFLFSLYIMNIFRLSNVTFAPFLFGKINQNISIFNQRTGSCMEKGWFEGESSYV